MKKKLLTEVMTMALFATVLTGCGSTKDESSAAPAEAEASVEAETSEESEVSEETEVAEETDASEDAEVSEETDASEEAEASEETEGAADDTAILVVSFGTSYNDSREATIGAIEKDIAEAYPQYEVRRAFTSQTIIDKLKERDGIEIDNVEEALSRAVEDGIKNLVIQPTHLMHGYEYTDLEDEVTDFGPKFDSVVIGEPLLSSDEDFELVREAIVNKLSDYDDGKTAIVYMGHGTEADSNDVYAKMQDKLSEAGNDNYYIGTVEAVPSLDDIIADLKENGGYEKVVLEPLMVVAGDHANNDMAGDDDDSWKSILTGEGYEVECVLEGLGQVSDIRSIYVSHVGDALEGLQ